MPFLLGYGMYNDFKGRIKYYKSDWLDALEYRTIPATTYIFFTNLLPSMAFSQDLYNKTNTCYGVNEVLLSSAIAGVAFGIFSCQPLCIVGVTGPISIFSYTVYQIVTPKGINYFPFMCWVYLWSMVFHLIIALTNLVNYLKFVTKFSCDIFGFFICIVYIQKGISILNDQFHVSFESGYCSVMIGLLMVIFGVGSTIFGSNSNYLKPPIRKIFADYGVPLSVIFFTGFIHFGGALNRTSLQKLPITKSFQPTLSGKNDVDGGRAYGWFIHFWEISVGDVFLAIPFAILLTLLFYFDHNVSSLMCQSSKYPLKKPSGFHWDFFLLGLTTGLAGIVGIPAPNGLIPQAPLHSDSLCVVDKNDKIVRIVEQRATNTLQGLMTVVLMTRPFLVVLGLIPQAVLAGLFLIMGITGINGNEITNRIRFFFMERSQTPAIEPFGTYKKIKKNWLFWFTLLELIGFGAEFGITNTKGAVGFPGVLFLFAIIACFFDKIFPKEQLVLLDCPTADSFIIRNLTFGKKEEDFELNEIEVDSSG